MRAAVLTLFCVFSSLPAVEPNSGSSTGEVDEIILRVDISALSRGVYDCNLIVSCPNTPNSPQPVRIQLIVEGPTILSSESVSFEIPTGSTDPIDKSLWIRNDGGGTLNWQKKPSYADPVNGVPGDCPLTDAENDAR